MRLTHEMISCKRKRKDISILITGATGFLGSHLAFALLKRGFTVTLLNRPLGDLSGKQRTQQILRWFGASYEQFPNLGTLEGFIDQEHLGLEASAYESLLERTDEIFHCAADTSFAERKREVVERANLDSLRNALDFAAEGKCYFFHYLSTAFSSGINTNPCKEDFVANTRFTNVYEETKHKAEKMALERCRRSGIRLNIYRPSIVYGDSRTGKSIRFNALYYPVKLVYTLRNLYTQDIENNGGKAAADMGVHKDSEGCVYLPLRIIGNSHGGLNLIPIDFFMESCMAIWEESLEGDIFHIVNNRTNTLQELITYVQDFFGIRGIEAIPESKHENICKNPLEKLVESYLSIYQPYMQDTRIFSYEKANRCLQKHNIFCPEFDYEIFKRIIRYAIRVKWGKKLFS